MSEIEDTNTQILHQKIDKLMQDMADMRVSIAEMSTAQRFMSNNHKDRIDVEKDMEKRLTEIEHRFNYFYGVGATIVAGVTVVSNLLMKKVFG